MESAPLVDCAGRPRSPATLPGYHRGRPPRNKGLLYPPDPPTVEEIIAAMRAAGDDPDGVRLRGVIVVLWRARLRISEALALAESDLDRVRGAIQVRHGKGGRRREVGMDRWAWEALDPWLNLRAGLPMARRPVSCAARLADGRAQPPGSVSNCATPRSRPGYVGGWRLISSGMPTQSRCRGRASRSWSYSGNWGMPTSGSRPCTCAASTTPRSCTPSTSVRRR